MNQFFRIVSGLLLSAVFLTSLVLGQATPGGTIISNTATATYGDGSGTSYNAVSNQVNITVANVAGLVITPDNQALPSMVPGQVTVQAFTVTNTGNFSQPIAFGATGSSATVTGPATITKLVIDVNGNGIIDPGDTDILANGAAVNSAPLAQNASLRVLAEITINVGAAQGSAVTVKLGDSAADSVATNASANEVKTTDATAINGILEAAGSYTTTVDKDAEITITLTAPGGPLAPGSDINYSMQACNSGDRAATAITLPGAPLATGTSVFLIAPIPANTTLKAGQSFPLNTLYSVDPLATAPTAATWSTTVPAPISTVTRIAFPGGASIAGSGACSTTFPFIVTINPGVNPVLVPNILEIVDVFANNALLTPITDQSGDVVGNRGDGNANFNEGAPIGSVDGNGVQQPTALAGAPGIVLGPAGSPGSSQAGGYATPCQHYDAVRFPTPDFSTLPDPYIWTIPKEIRNTGTLPMSFGLIQGHKEYDQGYTTSGSYFTVAAGILTDTAPDIITEVSFDGGGTWTALKNYTGLSSLTSVLTSSIHTVDPLNVPMNGITLAPGQSVQFLARHTIPKARLLGHKTFTAGIYVGAYFAGTQNPMYPTYTSAGIPLTWNGIPSAGACPSAVVFDNTRDVLVGDMLDIQKSLTVTNTTGVGGATDAVPGAVIEYILTIKGQAQGLTGAAFPWDVIQYSLPASAISVSEDGLAAPNNWGNLTDQVVGSATCDLPFTVSGDTAGSTNLNFTLTGGIQPGAMATCRFRRTVK